MTVNVDKGKKFPVTTVLILCLTGLITGLQFPFPVLLTSLRRETGEIGNHEYWRLLTSLFVHNGGWPQIAFNFTAIAVVGIIAERIFGKARWLVFYFAGGLIGQIAGLYWKPLGGGASVAGAGLLGALAVCMVLHPLWRARFGGAFIILGGCTLIYFHDLHGPPILGGAAIAVFGFKEIALRETE